MASIGTFCCCLILFISFNRASSGEYTGLLSRLYKKAAKSNRPLILVIDNDIITQKSRDTPQYNKQRASDTEDEDIPYVYLYNSAKLQKKPKKLFDQKSFKEPKRGKMEQKTDRGNSIQKFGNTDLGTKDKKSVGSPIVQGLLSLRNSLRCGAKNECEDECSNKFRGKKKKSCQQDCEVKYSCEEPDPCEKDNCEASNECAPSNECTGSTKGEYFVTEKAPCPRC